MGQFSRATKALLSFEINDQSPLGRQIIEHIQVQIKDRQLKNGTLLPGTRELADQLKVNRKTAAMAYAYLIDTGWLTSIERKGTFVAEQIPVDYQPNPQLFNDVNYNYHIFQTQFREFDNNRNIVFNAGLPDSRLIPLNELARAYRRLFQQKAKWRTMGYNDEKGDISLREGIAKMLLADRGVAVAAENICITRGSQMAIYLIAQTILSRGDVIAVEDPGYLPAWEVFKNCGAQIVPIPVDEDGISVTYLRKISEKLKIKAIYLTPQHQYPTTVVLKGYRRQQLTDLAEKSGFVIIEDDYDHEYHFKAQIISPMASRSFRNIIYISSFSKLISPVVRVGYIAAPSPIIDSVAAMRLMIDRQGDVIMENAIAELLNEGVLKRHTKKAYGIYKGRRELMGELINFHMGDKVRYKKPEGGLAYWLTINDPIETKLLTAKLLKQGVQIIASEKFSFAGQSLNSMRLGFASLDEQEMEEGIKKIAAIL
ncbi:PLP-dependent aminotransferase family protein [Mucilaginibacter sp. X4EP1]|uniref:MocR-like pyridoxine biosynthesis transcription factor PdxR n=1 Tax=Mucilaginibacter sp. X4EP1 TaxID=2723092 RepID=UPI002169B867|nr:PLP-dependent aminotransferase family protein [Mucilaginibacter sp. X4EP1]MCS3811521.1 GntR family transcriptional regulator/MocR family aminotransferase [Mucilaginibacter sp. X4EP1]